MSDHYEEIPDGPEIREAEEGLANAIKGCLPPNMVPTGYVLVVELAGTFEDKPVRGTTMLSDLNETPWQMEGLLRHGLKSPVLRGPSPDA